jgi:hypothetical protein
MGFTGSMFNSNARLLLRVSKRRINLSSMESSLTYQRDNATIEYCKTSNRKVYRKQARRLPACPEHRELVRESDRKGVRTGLLRKPADESPNL